MKRFLKWFVPGLLVGALLVVAGGRMVSYTSTNEYCISCHLHTEADANWKRSNHYETPSGTRTSCVECHLPPKGQGHLAAKARAGVKDLWRKYTRNASQFRWEEKRTLEYARGMVFEESCVACHQNNFPLTLSQEGEDAHLYYKMKKEANEPDLHCINCHLNVGHYIEGYTHGSNATFGKAASQVATRYTAATPVTTFESYTETIPGSAVSFRMIAIPGGTFTMGSPTHEPLREDHEGPQVQVTLSPFFMAEVEVTWDEYMAFYAQTGAEGRSTDTEGLRSASSASAAVDAISGATPPYGQPDQGWGMGQRPAISMSFHAAEVYCRWLSAVTGKKYRLPTEAEWEYAARGGTQTPYFFEGNPAAFERTGWSARLRANDTTGINTYAVYKANSRAKTQEPSFRAPNPFGLRNMLGNVAEFCSDWYSPHTYRDYATAAGNAAVTNPTGPESGTEHVVRGGSYRDEAGSLRHAARSYTRTEQWLRTDPQIPKSIWWYSDCFYVGFRVVCEYPPSQDHHSI